LEEWFPPKITPLKIIRPPGGTNDARFFSKFGVKSVEFGVINDTIHAPNERTSIDEVEKLHRIFKRVIEEF